MRRTAACICGIRASRASDATLTPERPAESLLWPGASGASRLIRRLCLLYGAGVLALLAMACLPATFVTRPARGLAGLAAAAMLPALAGLLATWPLAAARGRGGDLPRLARRPQASIVSGVCGAALALLWLLRPLASGAAVGSIPLGIAAIVLTFPLLVAERIMAATPAERLPEAGGLQALLFVAVAVVPLGGLAEVAAALRWPWAGPALLMLGCYLALVAGELAARALAKWFLPPPTAATARAAVASLAALVAQPWRLAPDGIAAPIRDHLGVDFSRSWALRFARAAALPVAAVVALLGWGLTGVSLIDLDRRGIYERLGAPVAVWAPGAHLGLPWPLGRVRLVDYGVVHAVALGGDAATDPRVAAEAAPPAAVDRLWDSAHPAEVSYIIASRETSGGQSFQVVSVDMRVLYRVGMNAAAALRAAYAVAQPDALVRSAAGRLVAREFAGRTLETVLAADRGSLADALRRLLQTELDRLGSGLELMGVVIEAIHPPAGAAAAYHNVQAAEIVANTAIATERGQALATAAMARQQATDLTAGAQGNAADIVASAQVARRGFAADQAAARVGGAAFLLERYLANVTQALAKSPLVIVDHRLGGAAAPVIDLRSFAPPGDEPSPDD